MFKWEFSVLLRHIICPLFFLLFGCKGPVSPHLPEEKQIILRLYDIHTGILKLMEHHDKTSLQHGFDAAKMLMSQKGDVRYLEFEGWSLNAHGNLSDPSGREYIFTFPDSNHVVVETRKLKETIDLRQSRESYLRVLEQRKEF